MGFAGSLAGFALSLPASAAWSRLSSVLASFGASDFAAPAVPAETRTSRTYFPSVNRSSTYDTGAMLAARYPVRKAYRFVPTAGTLTLTFETWKPPWLRLPF